MAKNKLAFSFIELAVIILIIGLITVGIMKGSSIIYSSRITSARSLTAKSNINAIPGLIAWYETSLLDSFRLDQTTDTTQLVEWRDISPDSIAAQKNKLIRTASSAVTYKKEGINGLPSVQFTSSGNFYLTSFAQGPLGQSTVFAVVRPAATVGTSIFAILDSSASGVGNTMLGFTFDKVHLNLGTAQNTSTTGAPSFTINSNYIVAAYYDNTNSRAFVNDAVTMAGGGTLSPGTNPFIGLIVGTNRSGSSPMTGLISEIIIYNRPLSLDERKSVMSYLSKKYKIRVTGI